MVKIPSSPGVLARPTTEIAQAATSMQETQIIPRALQGLGQTVSQIGIERMQREKDAYEASSFLEYSTRLKSFDNEQKIKLREAPIDNNTVNNIKNQLLTERKTFENNLRNELFQDNARLNKLADSESKTSLVSFEYNIDNDLSNKKRILGQQRIYNSISSLNDRAALAVSDEDFAQIQSELSETLNTGFASGLITSKDIERQENILKQARQEKQILQERQEIFDQVVGGALTLDPTSKADESLVNENFNRLLTQVENPKEIAEQIAVRTGILPDQAKSFFVKGLFAGDDIAKVEASEFITDVIKQNSSLEMQFTSKEKALSYAIQSRIESGLTAEQAVKYSEAELKENKSLDRLLRQGEFDKELGGKETSDKARKKIEKIKDDLQDESAVIFEAETPDIMAIQLRRIAKDYFLNEGVDMDVALDLAKDKVQAEWSITNVGKKRYQRFSPEMFYGIKGQNNKWIENQAVQEVLKIPRIEQLSARQIKKEISLEVIPDTIASGQPKYYIYRENEYGGQEIVLGDNNEPIEFKPDITKSDIYKTDAEKRDKLRITKEKALTFEERRGSYLANKKRAKELQRLSNTLAGTR